MPGKLDFNLYENRGPVERAIAAQVIHDALAASYTLGVNDGEQTTITGSSDASAVLAAMFTSDEDWLLVYREGKRIGWVRFVYGNYGWDVVSDYTTNLQHIMQNEDALSKKFQAQAL